MSKYLKTVVKIVHPSIVGTDKLSNAIIEHFKFINRMGTESFVSLKNVCSRQTVGCFKTAQRQAAIR